MADEWVSCSEDDFSFCVMSVWDMSVFMYFMKIRVIEEKANSNQSHRSDSRAGGVPDDGVDESDPDFSGSVVDRNVSGNCILCVAPRRECLFGIMGAHRPRFWGG